jgi:hypothetical protein
MARRPSPFSAALTAALARLTTALAVTLPLLLGPGAAPAFAGEAVLERYTLGHGGDLSGPSGSVSAFLHDDRFGNGTAEASVFLDTGEDHDFLHLRVWRQVPPGQIVFALLVFRVEVRGYDFGGKTVHSRDLADFSFGDSASGQWLRKLRVPKGIHRWEVTFVGNYE